MTTTPLGRTTRGHSLTSSEGVQSSQCDTELSCADLFCVVLCRAVACCAALYYGDLCRAVLCCATSYVHVVWLSFHHVESFCYVLDTSYSSERCCCFASPLAVLSCP